LLDNNDPVVDDVWPLEKLLSFLSNIWEKKRKKYMYFMETARSIAPFVML